MRVQIAWDKAVNLGPKAKFLDNLESAVDGLPDDPGIYVFARQFGKTLIPIYIGQASNGLRGRLKLQFNNFKLMKALANEKTGNRVLLLGRIKMLPGQQLKKVLKVAEQAHIEHALTAGFPLVNIQGTKTKRHEVVVYGPKSHKHPFPSLMYLATKGIGGE